MTGNDIEPIEQIRRRLEARAVHALLDRLKNSRLTVSTTEVYSPDAMVYDEQYRLDMNTVERRAQDEQVRQMLEAI